MNKEERFGKIIDGLTIDDFSFSLKQEPYYIKANQFYDIKTILDKSKEKRVKFGYVISSGDERYYNMLNDRSVYKQLSYDKFHAFYDRFTEYDAIETTKYYMIIKLVNFDKFIMLKKLIYPDNYTFVISEVDLSPLVDFGNFLWRFTDENEEIPEEYKEKTLKKIKSFLISNCYRMWL